MAPIRLVLIGMLGFVLSATPGYCQTARVVTERCEESAAYKVNTTIFMIDKTTNLSEKDKSTWRLNTGHLFDDSSIFGRVILVEIRDSSVSYTVSYPYCIPVANVRVAQEITQVIPGFEWRWTWLADNLLPWLWATLKELFVQAAAALSPNPYPGVDPRDQRITQRLVMARANVRAALIALTSNDSDSPSTDIRDPLFSAVSVYCAGQSSCRLYLFSDLIDSSLMTLVRRGNVSAAIASANSDYDRFSREYIVDMRKTKLLIFAWGVGRDEVAPNTALSPMQRTTLKQYWATMFRRLCTSASPEGSSISMTDIFSASGGKGC